MHFIKYVFALCLVLFTFLLYAQDEIVTFKRISTKDGLSQNDIRFIFQDSRGFMWIGTYDGLNRYDGYNFKIFRRELGIKDALGSNLVSCITEDAKGNLWIGTDDDGIYYFDRDLETFKSFKNNTSEQDLLTSNQISDLYLEKDEYLWAATPFGLNRIKVSTLSEGDPAVRHFFSDPQNSSFQNTENRVWTIFCDKFSNIWFGTPRELLRFVPGEDFYSGEQFISYLTELIVESDNNGVVDIAAGEEGLFLAAGGLVHLDYDQINTTNPSYEIISELICQNVHVDMNGDIWAGSNDGLLFFEMDNKKVKTVSRYKNNWLDETSISKNIVTEIYEDNTNIIWIGTNGGGLNIFNPFKKKFRHYKKTENPKSLSYNKIRAVYEDQFQNLWLGTEGGGVNFLPAKNKDNYANGYYHYNIHPIGIGENYAFAFSELVDSPDRSIIWIGGGVPTALLTTPISRGGSASDILLKGVGGIANAAFTMLADQDSGIWVGTYGEGIFKYAIDEHGKILLDLHYKNDPENSSSLSSNIVRSICKDFDSNLWIGTADGLNKLTVDEQGKKDPTFVIYKHDDLEQGSISHDYILPIFQSVSGDIWVGTMGGGLNKLVKGKHSSDDTFEYVTTSSGLPNNTIKGILEDENQELWISSNNGITNYNPRTKSIRNYNLNDGLQDNEFSEMACFKRKNGEMIFGGVNGFNVFRPSEISDDIHDTKVVFTQLQVLNDVVDIGEKINGRVLLPKSISETEEVILKYSERSFTISFAGLNFSAPAKNKYAYKLEGFDDDWIYADASIRNARYTNLSPDDYVFVVKASNSDGIWSSFPASIKFTIITPIWMTEEAFIIYFILLLLMLWFFRKYSIIAIREKNELLLEHFEKEKVEELSQMKLRFFTNISHEFRTPLTLILGPLERLIQKSKNYTSAELNKQYSIMYRNSKVLLNLINQLMDFRKLEQGKMKLRVSKRDIIRFIEGIRESFGELAKNKEVKLVYKSELSESSIWYDEDKLEKILYNLLSNAFKFSPAGGTITISVSDQVQKGSLQIRISDTGKGIPKEIQSHLFERFYQAEKPVIKGASGTGIGLSFVKGLVELHHGSIRFESFIGKGTSFTFLIPVQKEDYNSHELAEDIGFVAPDESDIKTWLDMEPIDVTDPDVELAQNNSDRQKILVIEDNKDIRMYLRDALSDQFTVLEAGDGVEGLQMSIDENPDLVISDVMMPNMDGFEFCQKMKSDDQTNHIPIILLTAKETKEDQIRGYEFGADDFVSKPFNMEVLLARILGLLESRKIFQEKFKQAIDLDPSDAQITSIDQRFLSRLIGIIEESISDPDFTVEKLANEYGIAQVILNKKLKAVVNQTARSFIRSIRLKRAAQLLKKGRYSVADVTYEVGFNDLKYFRDCFKKEFSVTPSEYLRSESEG